MKTFLLLLSFMPLLAMSQQNFPLIKDNGVWRSAAAGIVTPPDPWWISKFQFVMDGDTLISNKTYKKLYSCDYSPSINNKSYIGVMRQDTTEKIYFTLHSSLNIGYSGYHIQQNVEYLLYDFLISVGDTFIVANKVDSMQVLQSIDSVLVHNEWRKRWTFIGKSTNHQRVWIDGIGDTKGLFYPFLFEFEDYQLLTCYEDSNDFWLNPELVQNGTDCFAVGIEEANAYEKFNLSLYPNPATDHINIDIASQYKQQNSEIIIYNSQGTEVYKTDIPNNTETINLNINQLPPGVYFLRLLTDEGIGASGSFINQ